jgi:hypothetical protein
VCEISPLISLVLELGGHLDKEVVLYSDVLSKWVAQGKAKRFDLSESYLDRRTALYGNVLDLDALSDSRLEYLSEAESDLAFYQGHCHLSSLNLPRNQQNRLIVRTGSLKEL